MGNHSSLQFTKEVTTDCTDCSHRQVTCDRLDQLEPDWRYQTGCHGYTRHTLTRCSLGFVSPCPGTMFTWKEGYYKPDFIRKEYCQLSHDPHWGFTQASAQLQCIYPSYLSLHHFNRSSLHHFITPSLHLTIHQIPVKQVYIPYFFEQTPRLLFILLLILCSYYSRAAFISLETLRRQRWLGKVRMSEMVTVARGCNKYTQPLSPSASMVTVVRSHLHMCAHAAFITSSCYSRAVSISFKSFGLCGYYSREASIWRNMVLFMLVINGLASLACLLPHFCSSVCTDNTWSGWTVGEPGFTHLMNSVKWT